MRSKASPGKHALLVGIDEYPYFPPENQLRGCVHDVELMASVLTERFSFPAEQMRILRNSRATRDQILDAMEAILRLVRADDVVVFFYSGHGSQMLSDDPRETDGLDETLVPYDSSRSKQPNRDIRDKEIYRWVERLAARTDVITLILDSCHSGGAARTMGERWVAPDLRPPGQLQPPTVTRSSSRMAPAIPRAGKRGLSGWLPQSERYVLIAGSRDGESACELPAAEVGGIAHGALTYQLCREILASPPAATYRDVVEVVASRVSQRFPHQHPQLEGARDRRLFGGQVCRPEPYVLVERRGGDTVELAGGAVHGLGVGSRWDVFPAGTKRASDANRLGRLEILDTSSVRSRAVVLEEPAPGAIMAGCRAVVGDAASERRQLAVSIEPPVGDLGRVLEDRLGLVIVRRAPPPDAEALLVSLEASSLLRPCIHEDDEEPMFRCFEVWPSSRSTEHESSSWLAIDHGGQPVAPLRSVGQQGSIETLVADLEARARFFRLLTLENPDLWNPLQGLVEFRVLQRQRGTEAWRVAETFATGETCLHEGDHLAVRIRHRYPEPLFCCVLDLGVTGTIECLYPPPGASEGLEGDRLLELGTAPGSELEVFLPPEYPLVADSGATWGGASYLKLLVTTETTDFSQVVRQRAETTTRSSGRALGRAGFGFGLGQWLTLTKRLHVYRLPRG